MFSGSRCIRAYETGHQGCLIRSFSLNLSKNNTVLKVKSGGVGLKNLSVYLLKWSSLRLSIIIFSGSRCMRISETSHQGCLIGSFSLNFRENITDFAFKGKGGSGGRQMQHPARSLVGLVWIPIRLKLHGKYVCVWHLYNDKSRSFKAAFTFM